jgi:Skp family chaperone for outer membrane proteins
MRKSVNLILILVIGVASAATGYAVRDAADLVPGTYSVDLLRAVESLPGYREELASYMAPINARAEKLKAAAAGYKTQLDDLALLDPESSEYKQIMMSLQLAQAELDSANKVLNDAAYQINHDAFLGATRSIHLVVAELGKRKGYEVIQVLPIDLGAIDFTKPDQAFETLRQRRTMWVHPSRDVTDEVIAILKESN